MHQYLYSGPVMEFDSCIARNWKACTSAASSAKARSNLTHQFKRTNNRTPNTRITLPGKITELREEN